MKITYHLKNIVFTILFSLSLCPAIGAMHEQKRARLNHENNQKDLSLQSNPTTTETFNRMLLHVDLIMNDLKKNKEEFLAKLPNKELVYKGKIFNPDYYKKKFELYEELYNKLLTFQTEKLSMPQPGDLVDNFINQRNKWLVFYSADQGLGSRNDIIRLMTIKNPNRDYVVKKAYLYHQIKKNLEIAFKSSVAFQLSPQQKEKALLQGIKSKRLSDMQADHNDDNKVSIIFPTDLLSMNIQPLLAATRLQSIACIAHLNKQLSRDYLGCCKLTLEEDSGVLSEAEKIRSDLQAYNLNAEKAEIIIGMLRQMANGHFSKLDCSSYPKPQVFELLESEFNNKSVPMLTTLAARRKSLSLFDYIAANPTASLNDIKVTK